MSGNAVGAQRTTKSGKKGRADDGPQISGLESSASEDDGQWGTAVVVDDTLLGNASPDLRSAGRRRWQRSAGRETHGEEETRKHFNELD